MAMLRGESGGQTRNGDEISRQLATVGVELRRWPIGDDPDLVRLLAKAALEDAEKEQVLRALDHYFDSLAQYRTRDLIVLHPSIPALDELLAAFSPCHTHDDDEIRYIVDGSGVFGFVAPDGVQFELTVERGEYIHVPKGTEHYFYLGTSKRIKAIRYFSNQDGWTPHYTGTSKRIS